MKVIFLDIDGVLNSNDWYVKTRGIGGYNGGDVDPKCIELINDLIDATGAKIIMSSSWRSDYENSCEYLYDNGLYCDAIIGKTPHFCYTCQNDDIRSTLCRGNEIQYVLESKDITSYVIFDDAWRAMRKYDYFDKMSVVSEERIREELTKCFKYNTLGTLRYLSQLPELEEYIFKKTNLWLKPTNEK